jgi:uncharacterized iron-regulated protein
VERVFQTSDSRELSRDELFGRLDTSLVIYLAEKHDNARHHELQLEVLRGLVERGKRPAVGFEMFSVDQTSLLMSYTTWRPRNGDSQPSPEERLRRRLGWGDERDSTWAFYGPLLQLAREQGLLVFGADLPTSIRRRITRLGVAGLTGVERRQLCPTGFDHPAYEELIRSKLEEMHCGFGKAEFIGRLYETWVARNDVMAMTITETLADQPDEPVVLIVGAGHVQNNMGVYERVTHRNPGIEQANLGFREVAAEQRPLADYLQPLDFAGTRFAPDHEIIWFSPREEGTPVDPCEAIRRHMKKSGE